MNSCPSRRVRLATDRHGACGFSVRLPRDQQVGVQGLRHAAFGDTEFADMRAAWDTLDAETQALIRDRICEHSRLFSRGELGFTFSEDERREYAPVRQRLVRRHPSTGRLSLFLSSHGGAIVGWPLPEARALLRELAEHATQRERVYTHEWRQHDLVMWDSRVTMHRGKRFPAEQVRDMRRTFIT